MVQNAILIILSLLGSAAFSIAATNYHVIVVQLITALLFFYSQEFKTRHLSVQFLALLLFNFTIALLIWFAESIVRQVWDQIEIDFIIFFVVGYISGLFLYFFDKQKNQVLEKLLLILGACLASLFVAIVFARQAHIFVIPYSPILLGTILGFSLGVFLAHIKHYIFIPALETFKNLHSYMRVLALPAIAFFTGYVLLILFFSGIYALIAAHHPAAFSGPPSQFLDFVLFSYSAVAESGVKGLSSNGNLINILKSIENFIGIVWMTIMLAATLAFVQKEFDEISG